ncbi:MAG: bifunctional ornithine acetyltransferase/N-acetylglutamate synthase, partial [Cyanobacteria bacterium P01_H01_bin.130]
AGNYLNTDTVRIHVGGAGARTEAHAHLNAYRVGPGTGTAWGCDLSYDYVKINAEYTT